MSHTKDNIFDKNWGDCIVSNDSRKFENMREKDILRSGDELPPLGMLSDITKSITKNANMIAICVDTFSPAR